MASKGGAGDAGPTRPRALAFYLPQFHPIPENDEWWGTGFTEWTNVTRARPYFPGHYQPHVPGELGYYDLRIPEVREAQAALAAAYGISGFVYYHYWFHGRRLLERPIDEVLASGSPEFPIALCWANEEWTRNWDARTGQVLIPQEFSDQDDLAHIRWLATVFADDRYIKIDGRPLMLIYRPSQLPNAKRTAEIWRTEAQRLGFPDLYLCWVESWGPPRGGPEAYGMDATVGFMPLTRERIYTPSEGARGHRILDYEAAYRATLRRRAPKWKRFPSVMVGWDNSARRPHGATIFTGSTPQAYQEWLRLAADSVADVREEENYLFILAWNEWAEGNHLEPDQRYGRAFLEATRAVLVDPASGPGAPPVPTVAPEGDGDRTQGAVSGPHPDDHGSPRTHASRLLEGLHLDEDRAVVDLGAGFPADEDRSDLAAVTSVLDDAGSVAAITLLDVLGRLAQPHELLAALSAWSLKHGEPALVVSVSNVGHFDLGLALLTGRWTDPDDVSRHGTASLRFFTAPTLERLFERCGWRVVARDDVVGIRSDRFDTELNDALPVEMIGALRTLSDTYNPDAATQHFVWRLEPFAVTTPPGTYAEAIADGPGESPPTDRAGDSRPVRDYLESVGLVASETNRRAARQMQSSIRWRIRQGVLKQVTESPRTAALSKKVHGWLR